MKPDIMLKKLRTYIRYHLLARVWPPPATPFEHLKTQPRYQPQEIQLFGKPFVALDGWMFYGQYREIIQSQVYRFASDRDDPRIVDCGANGGLSIVYFKRLYPRARITGVEADPAIFETLTRNIHMQQLSDVTLINKAVSATREPVVFHREGSDSGRVHAMESAKSSISVDAVALDDLLENPVDLLKIDIEGSETAALVSATRLDRVKRMFVEYHSFSDQPQSLATLLDILTKAGFRYYIQSMFCPNHPMVEIKSYLGMDLQLNIFAVRV